MLPPEVLKIRLKCTKFDFGLGSAPNPAGGAYSAPPDPLAGFEGPTSIIEGRGGKREGREEKGGEGRKGGEGKGEEAFLVMWPRKLSALNPPLVTTTTRLRFDCNSTARRPLDDRRHDRTAVLRRK